MSWQLQHAVLVAFGATRKAGVRVEDDPQVRALLDSRAPVVTLVAKSDVWHVSDALRTTLEENLAMVRDTVAFLRAEGRRVFVDCEHFFDGYQLDPDYGVRLLDAARRPAPMSGCSATPTAACCPWACTTWSPTCAVAPASGSASTPRTTRVARWPTPWPPWMPARRTSRERRTATASEPATPNIFSVIGGLVTKMGLDVLPEGCLGEMQRVSHAIAEIANLAPDTHAPYVGAAAFAHKAGLHASAIKVAPEMYNHLDPAVVGNDQRILVTEMAGRASVELKAGELGVDVSSRPDVVGKVVERVKQREAEGWSYEAADASFELLLRDELAGRAEAPFSVESYRVIVDRARGRAGGQRGDGEAARRRRAGDLDRRGQRPGQRARPRAAQGADQAHPHLADLELTDYKVRIMPGRRGTDAVTRVLIETSDHEREWTTVGVHGNVIEASWLALHDAVRFGLLGETR